MRIALDAFGSDNSPKPEIEGAVKALKRNLCEKIYLVGKEDVLKKELEKYYYDPKRLIVVHASDVVEMGEKAAASIRKKKDSSLVRTIKLVKDGEADAAISTGNTGAVVSASLLIYGRISNVHRPAIGITVPTLKNPCILLDAGANVDCSPKNLVQFAELGNLYCKFLYDKPEPKVSLLNIGEEDKKGNELTKQAFIDLQSVDGLNFIGNMEGREILSGTSDVLVCDGFVGNVVLKTLEGVAYSIFKMMKQRFEKDWIATIGYLLSFPVFAFMKKKLDYREYGGALLLGVNGITVIGHGSSNGRAVANAIRFANKIASTDFLKQAQSYFEKETR